MDKIEQVLEMVIDNPAMAESIIASVVQKYKPVAYAVAKEIFKVYKDYAENKEITAVEAQHYFNFFASLCDAGFTSNQAMSILLTWMNGSAQTCKQITNSVAKGIS